MRARTKQRCLLAGSLFAAVLLTFGLPREVPAEVPATVLVVGQVAEPRSLDPAAVTSLNDFRIIANMFEGLVAYADDSLRVVPALARDWTIGEDGRTYTFHLRDGVRFHDGTPLTAEAVVFSFRRMLDPRHPYHETGPFPLAGFFFGPVEQVEAAGPMTVRFRLSQPFAPLLSYLAHPAGSIVSPTAVRRHGREFGRNPVGTGPFRFVEWRSRFRVMLARNPDHWRDPPRLEHVVFRPILDANTRLTELLAGQVDLLVEIQPDEVGAIRRRGGYRLYNRAGPHLWYLILNMKDGPFADRRMRRAVNHAIDRNALVQQVLQGTAEVAQAPLPAAFEAAHNDALAPYAYDPERARALIREAGRDGAEIRLIVPDGGSGMLSPVFMATAIQADLAAVGLDVTIRTYEWNAYLATVNDGLEGDADMAAMAWMVNDPDTLPYLTLRRAAWPDEGGFNSGYYANAEVDRLVRQARRAADPTRRAGLYNRLQAIVHQDAPWAVIASWTQTTAARSALRGFRLRPSFQLLLHDVYKVRATGG